MSTVSVDLEQIQEHEQSIDSQTEDNEIFIKKTNETVSAFSSDSEEEDKESEDNESPKAEVNKTDVLSKETNGLNTEIEVKTDLFKPNVVNEEKSEEKIQIKSIESKVDKSELILPNNSEKIQNIIEFVDENQEKLIHSEKPPPYHPPVQRVSRQLSPKAQNRPKIQRMEAMEGSIKLKKRKDSKDSTEKQNKSKESETLSHNSLTRIGSADEKHSTHGSGHKLLRNTNSSDSAQTKASKSTWTIEVHSPVKLQPILPVRPPQERLLPIGINTKEMRNKELREDMSHSYDRIYSSDYDKSVQTYKTVVSNEGEIQYPVCERLLPIGPTPPFSRKESMNVSPLIQQKKSGILQTPVHREDINKSKVDSLVTTTVSNTSASVPSTATIYAMTQNTSSPNNQIIQNKTPLSPRDSIDNIELKPKPPNSPIKIGVAKVVKASDSIESKSDSPKKESISKTNTNMTKRDSKVDLIEFKDESIEKVIIETLSVKPNTGSDKPEETKTQSTNVTSNQTSSEQKPVRQHYRQRKARKIGSTASELQRSLEGRGGGVADKVSRRTGRSIPTKRTTGSQPTASAIQSQEDLVYERCSRCGNVLEQFSEEEIGMCIIILGTYVHREPSLAAPILPEVLKLVSKFAGHTVFNWQNERSFPFHAFPYNKFENFCSNL